MQPIRKVALITGVGRGLGRGIALAFAREGAAACYPTYLAPEAQGPQLTKPLTDGIAEATVGTGATLDLATVLKAAQSLSSDITQDRLLETMMAVVIEHTGAQRGVFLREHDSRWLIVPRQDVVRGGVTSLAPVPIESCEEVPRGIIQYVKRTDEAVCLDDARSGERFTANPYLLRQQPKSIVCLPIFNQARLLGILYLENHLLTDAFTPPRLALLQVLSSQLAMSLEHAQVQAALQQEIEDRKQAEAALQHALAEVAQLQGRLQVESVDLHDEMARDYDFEEIVGHSPALMHVLHQVELVAGTDTTVLVLGETGTGKELIARAIHHPSAHQDRPLVKVNCAAFTAWTKVQLHRPAHAQKICEPSCFHLPSTEEDTIGCPFVTMAKTLKYGAEASTKPPNPVRILFRPRRWRTSHGAGAPPHLWPIPSGYDA